MTGSTRQRPRYDPVKARTRLLKRYGLKPEDFARLLLDQGGKCAICVRPSGGKRMLDIDHCHKTGEIRGLLCHRHNRGLGFFSGFEVMYASQYLAGPYTGYFVPKRTRRRPTKRVTA